MKIEDMPKDFTGNCWLHAADGTVLMSYTNFDRDTGRRRFYSFTTIESPMSNHSLEPFKECSKFEFPTLESKSLAETIQQLHERIEENRKDLLAKDDELVSIRIQRDKMEDLYKNLASDYNKFVHDNAEKQRDLILFRSLVEMFLEERNSRE